MQEVKHVIDVLEKAKKSALKEEVVELKELSNQTIHSATVYQDEDSILVAVFIYALSKIIEKGRGYYKDNYNNYLNYYLETIDNLIIFLKIAKARPLFF